jgi:hypothetical protein
MQGGGATNDNGPSVTVNVINNASGTQATATQSRDASGGIQIDVMVDQMTAKNVRNQGSETSKALRQTFALSGATTGR